MKPYHMMSDDERREYEEYRKETQARLKKAEAYIAWAEEEGWTSKRIGKLVVDIIGLGIDDAENLVLAASDAINKAMRQDGEKGEES